NPASTARDGVNAKSLALEPRRHLVQVVLRGAEPPAEFGGGQPAAILLCPAGLLGIEQGAQILLLARSRAQNQDHPLEHRAAVHGAHFARGRGESVRGVRDGHARRIVHRPENPGGGLRSGRQHARERKEEEQDKDVEESIESRAFHRASPLNPRSRILSPRFWPAVELTEGIRERLEAYPSRHSRLKIRPGARTLRPARSTQRGGSRPSGKENSARETCRLA